MVFKKVNGMEVVELGDNLISVAWLRSVSEGQAIRSCSDRNQVIKAWKIANGYSVPNYMDESTRLNELMKLKKPELADMANGLEIDFESDANKKTIANLIVVKEKEAQD